MLAYLIRHAESRYNLDPAAGLNSPLTPRGQAQALAVARRLRSAPISAIYASPFDRCLQTAEAIVAGRSLVPINIRPELWEYHHVEPGSSKSTELGDITAACNRFPFARACPDHEGPVDWPAIDETFEMMLARVKTFAHYLKRRWTGPDDTVVIISHGSPLARLIEAWLTDTPGPSFRFVIENAAITALRYESSADGGATGTSSLVCLNEISHLQVPDGAQGLPSLVSSNASNFNADGTVKPRRASSYW